MPRRALALLLAVALAACSSGGSRDKRGAAHDGPRVGGRLVISMSTEPRNLDAATFTMEAEWYVLSFLGAALVAWGPDGTVRPWLATDWVQAPDGKRLTFHLRPGVRFHSGRALVAADYAATFDRILATPSWPRNILAGVTAVRAPDASTLVFDLDRPNYSLLYNLADPQWAPQDPREVARWGPEYGRHPSSVGPYRLKRIRPGEAILLERNPAYRWAPLPARQGPAYIREIEIRTLPEPSAELAAFESGETSLVRVVPDPGWARLRRRADCQFFEAPSQSIAWVRPNLDNPILADVRVRAAIEHALDRPAILAAAYEGHGTAGYGAVHPLLAGYLAAAERPPLVRPHDPSKARRLLDEAGWRDVDREGVRARGGTKLRLRLLAPAEGTQPVAAELIGAQLRQVGIATDLELVETNTAFARAAGGDFQLFLDGFVWWGDAVDLMRLTLASSEIGGFNFGRYRSAAMDALLRRAREAVNKREHDEALAEAQRLFSRDAVFATIGYGRWGIALRRNVRGAKLWANLPYLDLHDAWIAP